MNAFEINFILDDTRPTICRKINVPSGITFSTLHNIIQIIFSFQNKHKYKFIFNEINLEIKETESLNQDTIDAKRELIDKYLTAFETIKYKYGIWKITLKTRELSEQIEYPQLVSYKVSYNPPEDIKSIDKINKLLENKNKIDLKAFSRIKTQKSFMKLFDIPYKNIEKHIVKVEEKPKNTLNKLLE
ncbi:MAG: hypothetical protein IJJ47_08195 [Methanosphaera sp.]|nr:hypothetical protein [Methanosphaera sp.]